MDCPENNEETRMRRRRLLAAAPALPFAPAVVSAQGAPAAGGCAVPR